MALAQPVRLVHGSREHDVAVLARQGFRSIANSRSSHWPLRRQMLAPAPAILIFGSEPKTGAVPARMAIDPDMAKKQKAANPYYQGPASDHFDGRCFFNPGGKAPASYSALLKWQLGTPRPKWPTRWPSPFPPARPAPRIDGGGLRITMVGHASLLIQTAGLNILTDPVWSARVSPLRFAGPKRVSPPGIAFADLPPIDIVLVSHNHYDHLDLATLKRLHSAHEPLVITPLVFVAWEDRGAALLKASGGNLGWRTLHAGVTAPEGWRALGGDASWGFVKVGHSDPARSNSGLQALYAMTLDYYSVRGGIEVGDFLRPRYQAFVREVEKGVPTLEPSTDAFMTDMLRFGPSKYDVAVVYESTALSTIGTADARWGKLRVYYPATTLWSDHPVDLVTAPWVTDAQRTAARTFVTWLRSRPAQEMSITYGFRPADPAVPIKTADPQNPFTRLADRGVRLDIPPMAAPPSGEVVRTMLQMWSRTAAR